MFIVEGNIGAGKSTFLKIISSYLPKLTTMLEPVESWHGKRNGASLLTNFIKDPYRWSYTMETFAMMKRVQAHVIDQQCLDPYLVVERSIYSGHYVFSYNGYQQGFMSEKEWAMYTTFFEHLVPGHCQLPSGFIYLQVDPEIACERITKRSRDGEDGIPLEYLQQLHERHESFLIQKHEVMQGLQDIPVLVLNVNQDFESDNDHARSLAKQVGDFVVDNASACSSSNYLSGEPR